MDYPNFAPSSRSFDAGKYPVKTYQAQDGKELRILYGNKPTNKVMELEYANIDDTDADQFFQHYLEMKH